ncbi:MAG: hypothetical protein PHR11_05020 [Candidatus Omnitrophica bacterium]|nr:hypothetical protein [Candidatus Omnitrophota bacterium]
MKKRLLLLFLCAACAGTAFAAQRPQGPQESFEYRFVRDFIESLRYQKSALLKQIALTPPREGSKADAPNIATFMKNLNDAGFDLKKAYQHIAQYAQSDNETAKKVSASLLSVYARQIKLNEKSLALYSRVYDPAQVNELDDFSVGKLMSEAHKIPLERENLNKLLADASILVTHMLYSDRPDASGKLSYLSVSAGERQALLQQIKEIFPEGEKYLAACADQVRQVLESKYKSADER